MGEDKDALLDRLCELAGLSTQWNDIFGKTHQVEPEDLSDILTALGLGASSPEELRHRIEQLEREARTPPPLVTAERSASVTLPVPPGPWRLTLEDGAILDGVSEADGAGSRIATPDQPGYHRLEIGGHEITLAVAPERCFTIPEAKGRGEGDGKVRAWGLALQLYSLRRDGDGGVGDYVALAEFAREVAGHGADALAISPVHAQFSADPDRFSPYAPSSRLMFNALHIGLEDQGPEAARLEALDLVDWPAVARDRLARLRRIFDAGAGNDPDFLAWREQAGGDLEGHALFEALHAEIWSQDNSRWHWRSWPAEFASPTAPGIEPFRHSHAREIAFQAWLQYGADRQLGQAHKAALDAGMAIGLVSDLAVGTDSGGSHCWSNQDESLLGLTIGAPPDLLQMDGQNWGISAFSARGLRQNGFRAFIEMLRGAMRHAGGVRIDHGMGIARLWIIPEGQSAKHGSYLAFPEDDLRRLIKLESVRNRAIVLAEDLGTVPEGFQERLQRCGINGMRILVFERDENGFNPPSHWTWQASAMTSTHDLAPMAGWWSGHDIAERGRILDRPQDKLDEEYAERARDRALLWAAMLQSGAAHGDAPAPGNSGPVVDAAIAHVGGSACELVMVPVEDALALIEQPNLPGTTSEHPNWRRRLASKAGAVLSDAETMSRLALLDRLRNDT